MDRERQLSAVLADETRFRIYRSIVERPKADVTVADIARTFGLHPNVARMHLGKLERAGLLVTSLRKGAGGGRPAKLYRLSDTVATIALPPRRYDVLADLALAALEGSVDSERLVGICRGAGRERGVGVLSVAGGRARDRDELAALVSRVARDTGMVPVVEWDGEILTLDIRNCVFKELSTVRPDLVCAMHRAYIEGVVEALTDQRAQTTVDSDCHISRGDDECRFTVTFR